MSRFDSLFARTAGPLLKNQMGLRGDATAIRLVKGSEQARHEVDGCILSRDNTDVARVAADSGYILDNEGERFVEMAVLEIPVTQEIDSRDKWIVSDVTWEAVGWSHGQDATFKTILLKNTIRDQTGPNNSRRR